MVRGPGERWILKLGPGLGEPGVSEVGRTFDRSYDVCMIQSLLVMG